MYTRASTIEMRELVLKSFTTAGCKLRIVIATTAFSMGIDCPDIHQVIHWGPPDDAEAYAQESARAGRDMMQATVCILHGKAEKHISSHMKEYCNNNTVCRRKLLFQDFLFQSECVDVPSEYCCDICSLN